MPLEHNSMTELDKSSSFWPPPPQPPPLAAFTVCLCWWVTKFEVATHHHSCYNAYAADLEKERWECHCLVSEDHIVDFKDTFSFPSPSERYISYILHFMFTMGPA